MRTDLTNMGIAAAAKKESQRHSANASYSPGRPASPGIDGGMHDLERRVHAGGHRAGGRPGRVRLWFRTVGCFELHTQDTLESISALCR